MTVHLHDPLGRRTVIDDFTHRAVKYQNSPETCAARRSVIEQLLERVPVGENSARCLTRNEKRCGRVAFGL